MQRVHFQVRVGVFNCEQILAKISFVIFEIVIKKQIECGIAWHWWNSTDFGLIDVFLINSNAEIVANLENTSKYGFPQIWGEKWRRSKHAHASYPGLFFRPPGFSPVSGGNWERNWTRDKEPMFIEQGEKPTKYFYNLEETNYEKNRWN